MKDNIRFKSRTVAQMAAAVAVLLLPVSCNKDKHEVLVEKPIGMTAFQAGTRALVNSSNDLGSQSATTGFGVFGYKTLGSDDTPVFSNTNVTASASGDSYTWSYTPLKYWDMQADYHFVAYWPHTTESGVVSNDDDTHTLTLKMANWQNVNGNEKDWLIATDAGNASTYYFGREQNNGIVYFSFGHLLALIEIQAWYYGNEDKVPTITSLDFGSSSNQVPSADGTVSVSKNYSTTGAVTWPAWSSVSKSNSMTLLSGNTTPLSAFSTAEDEFTPPENGVDEIDMVCRWLVIPFATSNCPLTVNYKIGETTTALQAVVSDLTFGTLESGKKYTLTLKFNTITNTLDPVSVLVRDWNDITDLDGDNSTNDEDERYNW
ncbi:MAG: fimbrillin family protein [Bacteroidaceae bacterium]|nr:fimbrillin family protein [Bacteroidaceae bacterium]